MLSKKYHAFVSYAGEDRDDFVLPLVAKLQEARLSIWIDRFCLRVGDSLREKIDEGLANSEYGIVVLSHSFFEKNWPQKELNALVTLEASSHCAILPIWKDITHEVVAHYSPLLADKVALKSYEGIEKVCSQLIEKIDPKNSYLTTILEQNIQNSDTSSEKDISVKVTAQPNMRVHGHGPYEKDKDYICISVNNLGPRTVIIEKVGLHQRTKDKQFMIASDCFFYGPRRLLDGERADYMVEQDLVNLDLVDYVWAMDKVGRTWRSEFSHTKG